VVTWFALACATGLAGCALGPSQVAQPATTVGPPTATASVGAVDRGPLDPVTGAAPGHGLKVAVVLPLGGSDQTALIARSMKQAAEMALFDGGRTDVQLVVKDDKGTPEGARAATEEAIREGAEVILGPLTSRSVPGAAAAAATAGIPVLAFSNDRAVAGPGVYPLGFAAEQDAERIVAYAAAQGKRRFAALVPDDAYGTVIGGAFRAAVAAAGGTIVAFETYPAGANAMIGPSRRIVEAAKAAEAAGAPLEAMFLPGGKDVLPQLGPLLTYAGFDSGRVKLLGSGAWEFATIGANDAFVGGWYPGPDPQGWRTFSAKFSKAYGTTPPRIASIAYDAMAIAISLAAQPPGQRFTVANLTRPTGFTGVDGPVRLVTGELAQRGLAVLEVQKIGSVIVEPAPASLDGARLSGTSLRVQ
jgi:ABC-type branched-subunit amino acid transport system substrate-binding protein